MRNLPRHYKFIALGYNCYPKKYIDTLIRQETNFFDTIGTSLPQMCELFESNFHNLFDMQQYAALPISGLQIVTHTGYYMRFLHDLDAKTYTQPAAQGVFIAKYQRRIARLESLLKSSDRILFIRLEENAEDITLLSKFLNILHEKYGTKNVKVLYLSVSSTADKAVVLPDDNRIIVIPYAGRDDWKFCDRDIAACLNSNLTNILPFLAV